MCIDQRREQRQSCTEPGDYGVGVTAAAAEGGSQFPPDREPVPPPDPLAIRACLTPHVDAEFDAEWDIVLDKAKQSKDLAAKPVLHRRSAGVKGPHDILYGRFDHEQVAHRDPGDHCGDQLRGAGLLG
jgi:hypothetical protein